VIYEFTEELGGSRQLHASLSGATIVAQVSEDILPGAGSALSFSICPADIHLFSASTGERMIERLPPATARGDHDAPRPVLLNSLSDSN
jgi:hypothetical protein